MPIKVLKFGGTSVANADAMERAYEIIRTKSSDKLVVVLSALAGVTNHLTELSKFVSADHKLQKTRILDTIESCHLQLIQGLFQDSESSKEAIRSFRTYFDNLKLLLEGVEILEELTPRVKDEILAFGEFFSSKIFYDYCRWKGINCGWLDAREVIATDDTYQNAQPNLQRIKANSQKIMRFFEHYDVVITQGFVGNFEGRTTTLGRGGSDLSASLFGYSIDAEEIQIWTDVNGVLSADPKLVENPVTIPIMSFDEVIELSFFGAKVLHPETIKPAMLENIPVRILNTFRPSNEGTLIVSNISNFGTNPNPEMPQIHSIVLLENCFLIKKRLNPLTKGFVDYYKILGLSEAKILHYNGNRNYFKAIIKVESNEEALQNIFEDEEIDYTNVDLIAFCGSNFHKPSRKVFNQINEAFQTVKPYIIHQFIFRSSDYSIILALQKDKGREVVAQLHNILVS
jgi:aspartate kinase